MSPSIIKIPFRIGVNEGVILDRKAVDSGKIIPYIDSLRGCVGLVVANDSYVFMSHVFSGHSAIYTGNSIDVEAKRYLLSIKKWMEDNGDGRIQVGLAASTGDNQTTLSAFEQACEDCKLKIGSRGSTGECEIVFNRDGDLMVRDNPRLPNALDILGTTAASLLVEHRIDANVYGFGGVLSGDGEEIYFSQWKRSIRSYELVKELGKLSGSYRYAATLLRRADDKIALLGHSGRTLSDAEEISLRREICERMITLLQQMKAGQTVNVDRNIDDIVSDVYSHRKLKWMQPNQSAYKEIAAIEKLLERDKVSTKDMRYITFRKLKEELISETEHGEKREQLFKKLQRLHEELKMSHARVNIVSDSDVVKKNRDSIEYQHPEKRHFSV